MIKVSVLIAYMGFSMNSSIYRIIPITHHFTFLLYTVFPKRDFNLSTDNSYNFAFICVLF